MKRTFKKIYESTLLKVVQAFRRHFLKNRSFTIISNNCWGGHIYQHYGLQYNTPTVGLTFFADEYIKFVSDYRRYLDAELKFIPKTESKYYEYYQEKEKYYPIGLLDDVEVVFLHYKSEEEARSKWNRRKARMNLDNLLFKFNDMNRATEEHIRAFDALPYENKICFVANPVSDTSCTVVFDQYKGEERIANDVTMWKKYINITKILNSMKKGRTL